MHRYEPLQAVGEFLRQAQIRDVTVTAALSGGADSVCLLHCLVRQREVFGLEVRALHVQHRLRGAESERDETFCRQLCEKWNVPLTVVSVDVRALQKEKGCSLETAARECRYAAFHAHAKGFVATAHTASDQFETMLFRLVRGTGLKGLCGIPPRRERFLRPLLHVSRSSIEQYLRENQLSFVTDSSNFSEEFTRNFLRNSVIPLLRRINPSLERTAAETAGLLREEEAFLEQAARSAYTAAKQDDGTLRGLAGLHPALQRRCIRRFLEENALKPDSTLAVQALLKRGGRMELVRGGVWICVSRDVLFLQKKQETLPPVLLKIGKNALFSDFFVEAEIFLRSDAEKFASVHKKFTDSALDYDIIKGNAVLHARQPGLKLSRGGQHVSVKKWLNESVPPAKRQYVHFLSDDDGLLWAEGLGTAARAAVTDRTQRMLVLRVYCVL